VRILAISGSLRAGSYNTSLLRAAAQLAPDGVELELYDGLEALPHYNADRDTDAPPAQVARLREQIAQADALLFATPEFNGTIPGALKNLIDWASRPRGPRAALFGKPAAVIGSSVSEYGAMWAQDHLRSALGIAGARVLDGQVPGGRITDRIDPDGELADAELRGALAELVSDLTAQHRTLARAA
jgi:chromate reductase, NAD(P)H dehydrogenase (quinone)